MADKKDGGQTSDAIRAMRRGTNGVDYAPQTALASADPTIKPAPTLKAKLVGVPGNA